MLWITSEFGLVHVFESSDVGEMEGDGELESESVESVLESESLYRNAFAVSRNEFEGSDGSKGSEISDGSDVSEGVLGVVGAGMVNLCMLGQALRRKDITARL